MSTHRTVALALAGVMLSAEVRAEDRIPTCSGTDPKAAAAARQTGLDHYKKSTRTGPGDSEMEAAVASFDAACIAGDDTALEYRAYALAALARFVDAAQTLDAFLQAHPLSTLSSDKRSRIEASQADILGRVASLSIESTPSDLEVRVDDHERGKTPVHDLRLVPGAHDIEIIGPAGPLARMVRLAPGAHTETFTFGSSDAPAPPPPADHTARNVGLGIGAGAGAVAVLGIILGAAGLDAKNRFDASGFTDRGLHDSAISLQTAANTSFVISGILATGAIVLITWSFVGRKPSSSTAWQPGLLATF